MLLWKRVNTGQRIKQICVKNAVFAALESAVAPEIYGTPNPTL
jgi:hypothetical protein